MENIVQIAMEETKNWKVCWWSNELVSAVIDYGVKVGWLYRSSVTQVEWTQEGFEAVKQAR